MCVCVCVYVCVVDYDAKKTMCSDSLECCPTLCECGESLQVRRDRGRPVLKPDRYFTFKVEEVCVCVCVCVYVCVCVCAVPRGECLS